MSSAAIGYLSDSRKLRQRREQRRGRSVVAKRFADVRKAIHVSRPKDEASTQLKRIRTKFVLLVAGFSRTLSRGGIVLAQQMQKVRRLQFRRPISLPQLVNQQREADARLLAKQPRVVPVA